MTVKTGPVKTGPAGPLATAMHYHSVEYSQDMMQWLVALFCCCILSVSLPVGRFKQGHFQKDKTYDSELSVAKVLAI